MEMSVEQQKALALARARRRRAESAPDTQEPPSGYQDGYISQALSGINQGAVANFFGAPVDLVNAGIGLGMKGVNAVAGTNYQPSDRPFLGSEQIGGVLSDVGAITPETDDPKKQFVRRVAEEVGAAIPGMATLGNAPNLARSALTLGASALGSGVGAATANRFFPDNPTAEMIGQFAGGGAVLGADALLRRRSARLAAEAAVPSVEDLKNQASAKYDQAEALGVTAPNRQVNTLAAQFDQVMDNEGLLITPDDFAGGYPKLNAVRQQIARFGNSEMTVPQMQTMRRTLQAAAKSADGNEARVGRMLLSQFDDFTAPLAPPLAEARGLYHRAMKGETLDTAAELAGARAGQFTGSGFENALRTEYRNLDRRIIKGHEVGFTNPEIAAIRNVSRGTSGSNIARGIGRMAPTGPVSFGATAGIPFAVGNTVGGPVVGAAAAGAASAGAYGARSAATSLGLKNAKLAELLVRNGAPIQSGAKLSPEMKKIAGALLAAQVANQAN